MKEKGGGDYRTGERARGGNWVKPLGERGIGQGCRARRNRPGDIRSGEWNRRRRRVGGKTDGRKPIISEGKRTRKPTRGVGGGRKWGTYPAKVKESGWKERL